MNILVVDDKPVILDAITDLLVEQGHFVETAKNGLAASEKILKNSFDLFIIDHLMPVMDGIKLLKNIKRKAELSDIPVIFMSTKSLDEAHSELAGYDIEHVMAKPVDLEYLNTIVASYQIENTSGVSL